MWWFNWFIQDGQQQTDLVAKYDLLWKFYEKSGQFIAAARVLSRLADAHSTAKISIRHLHRLLTVRATCKLRFSNFQITFFHIIIYWFQLEQTSASMSIQEELQRTQFLLSEDSLLHSAEYHSRLEVLKELNYVDGNGTCKKYWKSFSVPIKIRSFFSEF